MILAWSIGVVACSPTPTANVVDAGLALVITTNNSVAMLATPGAALKLSVMIQNDDGTTGALPQGTKVTWIAPQTIVAADPNDAGSASLPSDSPLAFFIDNPVRPDRTDYDGVLFIVQRGATDTPNVTVTATVDGFGTVSAYWPIRDPLTGDPDAGATRYTALKCDGCHGPTGAGSPKQSDGTYSLAGTSYTFPAPPLNAGDGGAAADPAWTGALFGLAAMGDVDNGGVGLRSPMPDFFGSTTAQDFADIYAFTKTQTQ